MWLSLTRVLASGSHEAFELLEEKVLPPKKSINIQVIVTVEIIGTDD